MRPSDILPIAFAGVMALAVCTAVASPALAAGAAPLSDSQYLALARCAGTAQGLGADAAAYGKKYDAEAAGRDVSITTQANDARDDARRAARNAGPDTKARLTREQDSVCKAYLG